MDKFNTYQVGQQEYESHHKDLEPMHGTGPSMMEALENAKGLLEMDRQREQEWCQLGKHFVDEEEIAIDDYGLVACFECYQNDPKAQQGMNHALANDPVELDHQ